METAGELVARIEVLLAEISVVSIVRAMVVGWVELKVELTVVEG